MAEKGFGTRVEIRADEEQRPRSRPTSRPVLDRLAEPQRRPFS